ncbi:branched-chain amino acid ABC transporter permease [Pelagibacterium limicola]|uniref:branched-chain amino acid ABC transporter permease n=1 Tax=Pelagibacterium limicola TaxID=2791022 RepID=UPI0018AF937A|nr:branched-chain amino acid ABC transporter permease [Pelagibacterium limicola]
MLEAIVQGVLLGGYYAVIAAGLSLMLGVVRFINLAHGDLAVLGAYLALAAIAFLGLPVWWAFALVLPVMAGIGWGLQRFLFARTLEGGFLLPLLATFGLGAVLQNGMQGIFGSETRSLANYMGNLSWAGWQLPFGLYVGVLPVLTFAAAVIVLGGLQVMLSFTKIGRAMRATSTDPEAAELQGVDARRVQRVATAIAFMLAGLAGMFLAMRAQVTPYAGPAQLIFAFQAVIIGGIGSLWGTLIGGIALGVAQSLGASISAQWFQLAGHFLFFVVLAIRMSSAGPTRERVLVWFDRIADALRLRTRGERKHAD